MADRSRTIDRLRRLLALEGSSNVHESAAARAAAERIMARHGLRREDAAEDSASGYCELPMGAAGWGAAWRFSLVTVAARHCGAEAVALRAGGRRKIRLVGERRCAEAAKTCYEQLLGVVSELERRVGTAYGEEIYEIASWAGIRAATDSFRRGVVLGIARKLARSRGGGAVAEDPPEASAGAIARVARQKTDYSEKMRARFEPSEQPIDLGDAEVLEMFDLGLGAATTMCRVGEDGVVRVSSDCRRRSQ